MEIEGKVIQILPEQTGEGKNGPWRKNTFVVETQTQYPKKICLVVWGDKFDKMPIQMGNMVSASIDIESREYNGNWYTDVKAWKVVSQGSTPEQSQSTPMDTSTIPPGKEPDLPAEDYEDDLPF